MSATQLSLERFQRQNAAIFDRATSWAIIACALNLTSSTTLTPLRKITLSSLGLSCFANFVSHEIFEDNSEEVPESNSLLKKISVFAGSALTLSAVLDIIAIYKRAKWPVDNLSGHFGAICYTLAALGYSIHKAQMGLQIVSRATDLDEHI